MSEHELNLQTTKLNAEISKLIAETSKINADIKKVALETRWYVPLIVSGATFTLIASTAAVVKIFL